MEEEERFAEPAEVNSRRLLGWLIFSRCHRFAEPAGNSELGALDMLTCLVVKLRDKLTDPVLTSQDHLPHWDLYMPSSVRVLAIQVPLPRPLVFSESSATLIEDLGPGVTRVSKEPILQGAN